MQMEKLQILNTVDTIPSYEVAEMMDKKHYEVLKMIQGTSDRRGIIEVLNDVQMDVAEYFIESTYVDAKGEERVCYECTKLGCDMLANKMTGDKGIIFTAKYVKAFDDMRQAINQITQIAQQQQPLQIGPRYSYNNYWIKRELISIKPTEVPEYIDGLLEHIKDYKPADRLNSYKITRTALQELQPTLLEAWQREMVQASLNKVNKLIELQNMYINRTDKSVLKRKNNQLEETIRQLRLDSYEEYYYIQKSGFTVNKSYCGSKYDDKIHCTKLYNDWKADIAIKMEELPTLEELGVDYKAPMKLDIFFYLKDASFDVSNCSKSLLDALEAHYKKQAPDFNDNLFADTRVRKYFSYAGSYDNCFIAFGIKNLTDEEIAALTFDDDEK